MKNVRFVGHPAKVFNGIGELQPGDVIRVTDAFAENLLRTSDFELVQAAPKKDASVKLDVDKNATSGVGKSEKG